MVVCSHSGILSLSFMMLSYLSDFLMKRIQLSIAFCHMAHLKMPVVTYLFFKTKKKKTALRFDEGCNREVKVA